MTKEIQKVDNGVEAGSTSGVRVLIPSVDIQELADSYVVRLDIPGADKETIIAHVDNTTLNVAAKIAPYSKRDAAPSYDEVQVEYRREFSLADNVETDAVDAVYELGVLKITLKKKQQFLPKKISIQ